MTQQRKKYLQQAGILLAVYLFLRYLLPLGMPFFLAWLTVHFLVFLQKWIRMRLLPLGICFLAVCILLIGAGVLCGCTLLYEPCQELIPVCRDYWSRFSEHLVWIPESLSGFLMDQMPTVLSWLLGIFIYLVSVLFLAKDWERVKGLLQKLPFFTPVSRASGRMAQAFRGWARAQGKIMLVISAECAVGYFLLHIPFFWFWAILTGLVDALPVFGTGVVFVPWVVIQILQGNFAMSLWLAVLLAVTWLTREFLEPRLLGGGLGLLPIGFLMSVIVGLQLFGPFGLFSGPFGVLLIKELWAELEMQGLSGNSGPLPSGDDKTSA